MRQTLPWIKRNPANQKTGYSRKLSAIERYNLVINETYRYNVDAIIEGNGDINLKQWQQAVAVAAQANPGCRVRLKSILGFCQWVDSGIDPLVKTISASDWDGYSERGADFLQKKIEVLKGEPVFEVLLIPGTPARAIFRGLHGAMDGRGLRHIILDVFRVLRGESPVGSNSTLTDLDIRLKHQDNIKTQEQSPFITIPAMPVNSDFQEPLAYIWRRVSINKNINNLLPKMAVFLASQARKHEEGNVAFTIPIDFRGLREEVNSTANLTGYIKIQVEPQDSARDIMKRINQEIRGYADCLNSKFVTTLPWIPISYLKKKLKKGVNQLLYTNNEGLPTGGIVSLGHFKPEQYAYPGFEATNIVGIPGCVGKLNVLIHNYTDKTQVVFSTPKAFNKKGQLDQLIVDFRNQFQ